MKRFYILFSYIISALIIYAVLFLPQSPVSGFDRVRELMLIIISLMLVRGFCYLSLNSWHDLLSFLKERKYRDVRYSPLVSVIIPAWNEEVGIRTTVESVCDSSYRNIEIIVVDDGSTDRTGEIVQKFIQKNRGPKGGCGREITYIRQENAGKGSALNRGILSSKGEIIVTIDADSFVTERAIEEFVEKFKDPNTSAVMGQIRIGNTGSLIGLVQSIEYLMTFSFKKAESLMNVMYVVGGAAAAYRKDLVVDLGLFNEHSITEDIDLSLRILASGGKIQYAEEAVVYTEGANNVSDLIKQRMRWRKGRFDTLKHFSRRWFSKENRSNAFFKYVQLPFSVLLEVFLFLEPIFIGILITLSIITLNFFSFATLMIVLSFSVIVLLLFNTYDQKNILEYIAVTPVIWMMLYIAVCIEYISLLRVLSVSMNRGEVRWQKWSRTGVHEQNTEGLRPQIAHRSIFPYLSSITVLGGLLFIIAFFYLNLLLHITYIVPLIVAFFFAVSTDGLFLSLHLRRKAKKHENLSFDPTTLSILIVCYNGEDIIGETLRQVLTKVPKEQIYVISDNSKDRTVEVARSFGVNVFENEKNYNKALSINRWIDIIETKYVLILDDDTHIEETFIPTSLLDEGYSAVAFNVMPEYENTLVNKLQQYEYRKSMHLGKLLRGSVGAIGNVSGAIGLFKTSDLQHQAKLHSGQFGGEDQQRTLLVHLNTSNRGIAYTNSTVYTEAPPTFVKLFKQRAFKWGTAVHETFWLCIRILFSRNVHYLLKVERAYLLFILLTDPMRIVLFLGILFHPEFFIILYCIYTLFEMAAWRKTGRKDPLGIVLLSPLYNFVKNIARFIAHFYWYRMKYDYVIKNGFHRLISGRKLLLEYASFTAVLIFFWYVAVSHFLSIQGTLPTKIFL